MTMRKRRYHETPTWSGTRLVVPVVSATGGAGRSTVAEGLSRALTDQVGAVAVADCSPRGLSPWRARVAEPCGGGLAALGTAWDRIDDGTARLLAGAVSYLAGDELVHVYTDTAPAAGGEPGGRRLLAFPPEPRAWQTLLATYRGIVVDTPAGVTTDVLYATGRGRTPYLPKWFECGADAVAVLTTTADARAAAAALEAVTALEGLSLPTERLVVAVVNLAPGGVPRRVRSRLALLEGRVGAVVELPYDPALRAEGVAQRGGESADAFAELAAAVLRRPQQRHDPLRNANPLPGPAMAAP